MFIVGLFLRAFTMRSPAVSLFGETAFLFIWTFVKDNAGDYELQQTVATTKAERRWIDCESIKAVMPLSRNGDLFADFPDWYGRTVY